MWEVYTISYLLVGKQCFCSISVGFKTDFDSDTNIGLLGRRLLVFIIIIYQTHNPKTADTTAVKDGLYKYLVNVMAVFIVIPDATLVVKGRCAVDDCFQWFEKSYRLLTKRRVYEERKT